MRAVRLAAGANAPPPFHQNAGLPVGAGERGDASTRPPEANRGVGEQAEDRRDPQQAPGSSTAQTRTLIVGIEDAGLI
jgi:hypothetical protein